MRIAHTRMLAIVVALLSSMAAYAAGDAKDGKAVYDQRCRNCHGADGVANPQITKMMKVEIPGLGPVDVRKMSGGDLKKIVTDGKGKMPAMPTVTGKCVSAWAV